MAKKLLGIIFVVVLIFILLQTKKGKPACKPQLLSISEYVGKITVFVSTDKRCNGVGLTLNINNSKYEIFANLSPKVNKSAVPFGFSVLKEGIKPISAGVDKHLQKIHIGDLTFLESSSIKTSNKRNVISFCFKTSIPPISISIKPDSFEKQINLEKYGICREMYLYHLSIPQIYAKPHKIEIPSFDDFLNACLKFKLTKTKSIVILKKPENLTGINPNTLNLLSKTEPPKIPKNAKNPAIIHITLIDESTLKPLKPEGFMFIPYSLSQQMYLKPIKTPTFEYYGIIRIKAESKKKIGLSHIIDAKKGQIYLIIPVKSKE